VLVSLNVSRARIEGGVWLDRDFKAYGEVRFDGTNVRGSFHCSGAIMNGALPLCEADKKARSKRHKANTALNLDHTEIGSTLQLDDGFKAFGCVSLRNAKIHGDVKCERGEFHACWLEKHEDPLGDEAERQPQALVLSGAQIDGSVFLVCTPGLVTAEEIRKSLQCGPDAKPPRDTFRAFGQVRLRGTRIKRNLHLGGGRFELMPPPAVEAGDAEIRRGTLPLVGWFHSARIEGTTFLIEPDRLPACFCGSMSFAGMRTGAWHDSMDCWPQCRKGDDNSKATLELNGLTYDTLRGPTRGEERLIWLLHQPPSDLQRPIGMPSRLFRRLANLARRMRNKPEKTDETRDWGFKAQPWEQCAQVLYNLGYRRDARLLYRAQLRFHRVKGRLRWTTRFWNAVLDVSVGGGYRVFNAVLWAIWLVVIGMIVTAYGMQAGYIAPNQTVMAFDTSYRAPPQGNSHRTADQKGSYLTTSQRGPEYPPLDPFLFSLDTALPAPGLHQVAYWTAIDEPNAHRQSLPPFEFDGYVDKALGSLEHHTGRRVSRSGLVIALTLIAMAIFWFTLRHERTPKTPRGQKKWGKRYRQTLNERRGRRRYFTLGATVIAGLTFFSGTFAFYLDRECAFRMLDWADRRSQIWLGLSLPHVWTVAESLLGWVLVSAIVIGLTSAVFRRGD
jgi:hypothetical protein